MRTASPVGRRLSVWPDEPRTLKNSNVDEKWDRFEQAMHFAERFVCGPRSNIYQRLDFSRVGESNEPKNCKPHLMINLEKDRESWWVKKAEEIELPVASCSTDCLSLAATTVGGKLRPLKSCAIKMESLFLRNSRGLVVRLNASRSSSADRALM